MINISRCPSQRKKKDPLEMMESEIADWHNKSKLPRHVSRIESRSHRGGSNLGKINYMPRVCKIESDRTQMVNLAVDILKYQLGDRQIKQKHLENLRYKLEHRLQVAKTQRNSQLVNILKEEFKQLETSL